MQTKEVIKRHGFTIEQVGVALGKSKSGMSQIVNNDNTPPQTLRKIARVIGCDITEFFLDECSRVEEEDVCALSVVCPECGREIKFKML